MDDIKRKVFLWVVLTAISAGAGAWVARAYYQPRLDSSQSALLRLSGAVEQQGRQAQAQLAQLTTERDAKQNQLNAAKAAQEVNDDQAQKQIATLADQSRSQSMRVRVIARQESGAAGDSGASATAQESHASASSAANGTETIWLLPGRNQESVIRLMDEAEQINAAYASCRATLFSWVAIGPWQ